jgi:hypothetical protein
MNGKGARKKGHDFERKVAQDFRSMGFPEAIRALEYQAGLGYDLNGTKPFLVQCKALNKTPNIPQVFSEYKIGVDPAAPGGDVQMIVFKVDRKGEYAVLKWEDMQVLIAQVKSHLM